MTRASAGSSHRTQYTILNDAAPPATSDKHFRVSRPAEENPTAPLSLSNEHVQIWSYPETGLLQVRRNHINFTQKSVLAFIIFFCFFLCNFQKVRLLQSGLTRDVKVQFLWYGTRAGREKSGAYLFLPEEGGAQVRVSPGSRRHSLTLGVLLNVSHPSNSSTRTQTLLSFGCPVAPCSRTSLPVFDTSLTEFGCTTSMVITGLHWTTHLLCQDLAASSAQSN